MIAGWADASARDFRHVDAATVGRTLPLCLQLRADGAGPCRHDRRVLERRSPHARVELRPS